MLKTGFAGLTTAWVMAALAAGTTIDPRQAQARPTQGDAASVLRVARSKDGRRFRDTGTLFLERASSPSLVRLRNGDILALFYQTSDEGKKSGGAMAASSSADEGRSWSPIEPIRVRRRDGRSVSVRRGTLVRMPDRHIRLFFATTSQRKSEHAERSESTSIVRTAVTLNGLDFQLDHRVAVTFANTRDPHPTSGWIDDQLHLYIASPSDPSRGIAQHAVSPDGSRFTRPTRVRTPDVRFSGSMIATGRGTRAYVSDSRGVRSLISRNGRNWKLEPGIRLADAWDPAVIRLRDGSFLMLYCTWANEKPPAASQIADAWGYEPGYEEAGTTLVSDTDAGIDYDSTDTKLDEEWSGDDGIADKADEGYPGSGKSDDEFDDSRWEGHGMGGPTVMAVNTRPSADPGSPVDADASSQRQDGWSQDDNWAESSGEPGLVLADHAGHTSEPTSGIPSERSPGPTAGDVGPDDEAGEWADPDETTPKASPSGCSAGSSRTAEGTAQASEPAPGDLADVEWPTEGPDDWADQDALAFVPPPDFEKKIEYIEWYRTRALEQTDDNAYEAYASFMPGLQGSSDGQAEWPELHDMFNDREHKGDPAPWDPTDHPEWESSNDQVQDLLEKFREATTHEGYAPPPDAPEIQAEGPLGNQDLMIKILLPQLSSHRKLHRATQADAWRLRDGELSVDRMLDAWRTSLRGAAHLARGATLIEELVAMAERHDVQRNARWALKQIDFSADQLETALDLLVRYDGTHRDRTLAVVGEHATSMDTLQWVFMPARPGDPPRVNLERARALFGWAMEQGTELNAPLKALAEMGPDDIQEAIDASEAYYRELARMMRIGYPQVRASDVAAVAERYIHTNIWTELLFPNLSRVHALRAREEASRRATQLAFAVHLYKARQGRWPASLDELSSAGATRATGATGGLPTWGATGPGAPGPASADRDRMRTDPFTGKDFGYRVSPDGPTIYSFSENAKDDGGVHSPSWDDEITNGAGSDDYVFWPPQQRSPRK